MDSSSPAPDSRPPLARVFVCDDEELIRWPLAEYLQSEGYEVEAFPNGEAGLNAALAQAPDAIITDLTMPVMDGLTLLRRLRDAGLRLPVVVMTAHGAIESAIEATRLGASAYVAKPFDLRDMGLQLERALEGARISEEVRYFRDRERFRYGNIIGDSPAMRGMFQLLERLEGIDAPTVLISGESGTGKELVAQAIHARGPRRDGPFVEIDCASLPETLIESELFGHERGAFTDARQQKRGLLEVARGGTIFLDEIGELPLTTQSKLLRALETRRVKRVGGIVDIPIDAGIVAATNRELAREVEAGRFRGDLYYRLAVIPIDLPPLRARIGDVPALAQHFLDHFKKRIPGRLSTISSDAMAALARYRWPGNIRELKNVIERLVTFYRDDAQIELAELPAEIRAAGQTASAQPSGGVFFALPPDGVDVEAVEKGFVVQALERTGGNQTAAAKLLGLSRYALRNRVDKFGLRLDGDKSGAPAPPPAPNGNGASNSGGAAS